MTGLRIESVLLGLVLLAACTSNGGTGGEGNPGGAGGSGGVGDGGTGGSGGAGGSGGESPVCGDGRATGNEACDGADLRDRTCASLRFTEGELSCGADCRFDTSACVSFEICGNGLDDDHDGLIDCHDPSCASDVELCPRCGDGRINLPGEQCDGDELTATCADRGFPHGATSCTAICTVDYSACRPNEDCSKAGDEDGDGLDDCDDPDCALAFECPSCGNGVRQRGEACDGSDVPTTCVELGFERGILRCTSACALDTNACAGCGDGVVQSPERCDDGNRLDGDGCSAACTYEGDSCGEIVDLSALFDAATGTATWVGNSVGFDDDFAPPSCLATPQRADVVARFTAPSAGTWAFASGSPFLPSLWAWAGTCDMPGSELACTDTAAYGIELELQQGQTIFLAGGVGHTAGAFSISATRVECGNGVVEGSEACDDGNFVDGDGCSATCRAEGDDCANVLDLGATWDATSSTWSWSGALGGWEDDFSGSCGTPAGRDGIASFTAPSAGWYELIVPRGAQAPPALYVLSGACGTSPVERGCFAGPFRSELITTLELAAGETIHLVAEGDSISRPWIGAFELHVRKLRCGDGRVSPPEECDDGGTVDGDGCSASCTFEAVIEVEPNDSMATATPHVEMYGRGAIDPATDTDWWSFEASGGTSYYVAVMTVDGRQCGPGPTHDTELAVYDAGGNVLGHADSLGFMVCPMIVFSPQATGTYYAKVSAQTGVGSVVPQYFFLTEVAP